MNMIKRCVKMHLISSTYNTAIFEFKNKEIRQVLNHIQKEEQEHGEKIYNYMNQHNMYN
ncbi:spore coat protein [Paraclostridium sordellii]|uniref:spore coat protein n=2 Tax=Paraclostridium sordellii TaxID=1505 RepID=UPI0030CCA2FF